MRTVYYWLLGAWEHASDFTTNPGNDWIEVYDQGRAFMRNLRGME